MSARDGREGEGGKEMEDKEPRGGGGEMMLGRDGEGRRNKKTSRAFFILHGFHFNSIVKLIISIREKFFTFLMSPKATSKTSTGFQNLQKNINPVESGRHERESKLAGNHRGRD